MKKKIRRLDICGRFFFPPKKQLKTFVFSNCICPGFLRGKNYTCVVIILCYLFLHFKSSFEIIKWEPNGPSAEKVEKYIALLRYKMPKECFSKQTCLVVDRMTNRRVKKSLIFEYNSILGIISHSKLNRFFKFEFKFSTRVNSDLASLP